MPVNPLDTFYQFKYRYPIFIALLASILSTFGLLAEFKDSFLVERWGIWGLILGILSMIILSSLCSFLVMWMFFKVIQKGLSQKEDENYSLIEMTDNVHITNRDFSVAYLIRIAKYQITDPKRETNIYLRLPKYTSTKVGEFKCEKMKNSHNFESVNIKNEEIHSDRKLIFTFKPKLENSDLVTLRWSWKVINGFLPIDDFQLTSRPECSKVRISIRFDDNIQVHNSEWYMYYGFNQSPEKSGLITPLKSTDSSTLIEKNFEEELTGGISYKVGIHWEVHE